MGQDEKTYRLSMSEIKRLQGVDHEVGKLRARNKELEDACRKAYDALAQVLAAGSMGTTGATPA